jgi:hypothetical protein
VIDVQLIHHRLPNINAFDTGKLQEIQS